MKLPIYLDYSSTTPVDTRVVKQMLKYLTIYGMFGNPESRYHKYGWQALEAVDIARYNVSKLIGADEREIIFTSGATESNNLAIKGIAYANCNKGRHIITSITEHITVLQTCRQLEKEGFDVTWLTPSLNGMISLIQLKKAIKNNTILVSLMHVNNEIGVIQDIKTFGNLCRYKKIVFHVDATQSVGKLPIDLSILPVDLMSFSGHKIYGPKGIGVLFIRRCKLKDMQIQMHGGGQEFGIRSGTLPVHQIVGMGEACKLAYKNINIEPIYIKKLRNKLWRELNKINLISINGNLNNIVSNILNVSFHNIDGEALIIELKNIAISKGSACISSKTSPSYVLKSLKLSDDLANSSIRFSLGRFTTEKEIIYTIKEIKKAIYKLK